MADKKKVIEIKVETEGAKQSMDNLDKGVKKVDSSSQAMGNTLDKATGGAVSKFKALRGGIGSAVKGFKSLRVAIIGTGIGALLIAITSVASAFRSSEEGQNKFAKLMGVIGSVVGNLTDLLSDLGETIIEAFENPQKAWNSFTNSLKEGYQFVKGQVVDRFIASWNVLSGGFEAGVLKMRIAWNEFTGDSKEADKLKVQLGEVNQKIKEGVQTIKNANDQIVGLYEGAKNSIKEFGAEIAADAKAAQDIADQRAKADKLSRKLTVDRAEAERSISELREKAANKEKFTAKERVDFLKEAGEINEGLAKQEIEIAEIKLKTKQQENALSKSTKEDLEEEASLKAELINKETQRLKLQKSLTAEVTTASRESGAEASARAKEAAENLKALEKEKADALEAIRVGQIDTEDERRAEELRKVEEQYKKLLDQAKKYYGENSQQQEELEIAQKTKEDELKAKFAQEDKDKADKIKAEEDADKLKAQEAKLEELELTKEFDNLQFEEQREILKAQQQALQEDEILSAEQKSAELKRIAEANVKITELENKQKEEASLQYLAIAGNISNLLGKESEAGKAMAVATTLVSTYLGAQKAYESQLALATPDAPVRAALAAGVAVASGLANVKSILSVNAKGEKGVKGGGRSSGSISTTTRLSDFQQSSFDSAGQQVSQGNAQAIQNANAQSNQPTRAYVTSREIFSGNSLERNRVGEAGF